VPGFEDHLHLEGLDVGVLHHDIDEVSVEVLALLDLGVMVGTVTSRA
jgi:hypothetical protein